MSRDRILPISAQTIVVNRVYVSACVNAIKKQQRINKRGRRGPAKASDDDGIIVK